MEKRRQAPIFSLFLFVFLSVSLSLAYSISLPPALQKIADYNLKQSLDFQSKVSFLAAFLAGALTLLSPCILPLLPAYFYYSFGKDGKAKVTEMTLLFSLGVALVFVVFGALSGFLGEQSLSKFQRPWLVFVAGLFLCAMGILSILGRGFSSPFSSRSGPALAKKGRLGVFLSGSLFALGWSACVGPILSGILGIGAILGNPFLAAILMLFYSLGIFVPLFALSLVEDSLKIRERPLLKGREVGLRILGKRTVFHTNNLLSGGFLLLIGISFIVFNGTALVNGLNPFGLKESFYSLQRLILENSLASAILGGVLLLSLTGSLFLVLRKKS